MKARCEARLMALILLFFCFYGFEISDAKVLITEVYADTLMKGEPDEFIVLENFGDSAVNLEGWSISDGEGEIIFPDFVVQPHQKVYVAREAEAFERQALDFGVAVRADFEYENSSEEVPNLQTRGVFALRNKGDEVILRDKGGEVVDAVIFGDAKFNGDAWRGAPLQRPVEGMVFKRKGGKDTNTRRDWVLLWLHTPYFDAKRFNCVEAVAFVSPDCSFEVICDELARASSFICLNVYEFESFALKDALRNAILRGVKVKILLEGSPVGGMSDEEEEIVEELREAGAEVRFSAEPFVNHAKYAVIDGESVIIMTENWGNSGVPHEKTFGNRGWGIILRSKELAEYFKNVFDADFRRGKAELNEGAKENREVYGKAEKGGEVEGKGMPELLLSSSDAEYVLVGDIEPFYACGNITVEPILAPDNAYEEILSMLEGARERIYVEMFSAEKIWFNNECMMNPFFDALISAARRGCEVKVLLDAKEYNLDGNNDNDEVVEWLNGVARAENLNLRAEIADLDALGLLKIHNKGAIIDGQKVLISSLNWKSCSLHNREAGVIVESEPVARYYEQVFMHDWNLTVKGGGEILHPSGKTMSEEWGKIFYIALTFVITVVIFLLIKRYRG